MSTYEQWLDGIYRALECGSDLTRSDAQGIVDGQPFETARQWALSASPETAAAAILRASAA